MTRQHPRNKAETADSNDRTEDDRDTNDTASAADDRPEEIGGRGGLDPTRYGDWEKNGRCIDF